jgi:hypothetical protein
VRVGPPAGSKATVTPGDADGRTGTTHLLAARLAGLVARRIESVAGR